MEDAHGVIHHSKGVDLNGKSLVDETLANIVGKAAAHKEHALTGRDVKGWLWYLNCRLELHGRFVVSSYAEGMVCEDGRTRYPVLYSAVN